MTSSIEINRYLNSLFETVSNIDVGFWNIKSLPDLTRFKNLKKINCYYNELTSLPTLPQNLQELHCYDNELTSLPTLPQNLQKLSCCNNHLSSLPTLPENVKYLYCTNNRLTSL